MKHPLTSKERKGLVAVAAAALLCIASGPMMRKCSLENSNVPSPGVEEVIRHSKSSVKDSLTSAKKDSVSKSAKKHKQKNKGKKTKKKVVKEYPVRNPLDQPCDL